MQYGNNVTCLDATNKTADYSLPLFSLVVKMPTNYMVAGVFVVQFETAACISEALAVFKEWNLGYSQSTGWWTSARLRFQLLLTSFQKARSCSVTSIANKHGRAG